MKKIIAFVLAATMAMSLVACGGSSAPASSAAPAQSAAASESAPAKEEVKFPLHAIEIHSHKSGSTVEINTRIFAPFLSKYLGGTEIIIVNDDSMYTAFQTALNADPDGYTLSATTCNVQLTDAQGGLTYDSVDDGTFIGTYTVGGGYFVALTKKFADEHNVHTLDELVALTKAQPDDFTISTSYGAISELATYSLIKDCGIEAYPVDLADSNTRLIAFIEGDLDIFVGNYSTIAQYVENGEVEVLCFYGDDRNAFQPDYPCTKELGYNVQAADNYYYLTCAKDTPAEIVAILSDALEQAANDPEFAEAIRANSAVEVYKNGADTYDMLKSMRESLLALVQAG